MGTRIMEVQCLINVSFTEFLSGHIGSINLGDSVSAVEWTLGLPDDYGGISRKYKWPCIWKYGDFEFHFDKKKRELVLLYIDFEGESVKNGGSHFMVMPWNMHVDMSIDDVYKVLEEFRLDCIEEKNEIIGTRIIKTLNSEFVFEEVDGMMKLYNIAVKK